MAQVEFRALDDVSLSVEAGTIQGIIGFSGSGKTTLLRCISRLERVDAGRVVVDGADLAHLDGAALRIARRRLGIVFQQYHLLRSRTVAENVALPLELAGIGRTAIAARVGELLEWFGLNGKRDAYLSQLSGGQRQRVAIARALATKPAVLLSDEPTSALDAETTASVLETLQRVRDEMGITIILVTHELNAVRAICDKVAVLDHGRIVEQVSVPDLFLRPSSDAARRLLGLPNSPDYVRMLIGESKLPADSILLSLQLAGASAELPLLTQAARYFGIDLHVVHGEVGRLRDVPYGNLIVVARGEAGPIARAVKFLRENGAAVNPLDSHDGGNRA
ncbi:methionine ABC transporter ATP-binding protein [Terriglobus roseus]|uniref:methionine ABC transporter ATP-binding protein n=1 Tax=Terriglobus roseus TaxID=392734 RepID=UPI001561001C|nr:methionine ABC transporter ATP-binding protein [Terriglobus roseus]